MTAGVGEGDDGVGGDDGNSRKSLEAVMTLTMVMVCVVWVCEKIIFAFKTMSIKESKHFF